MKTATKKRGIFGKVSALVSSALTGIVATATTVMATGFGDSVTITATAESADANSMMGKIIGLLLTFSRFVGIALVVYGVYEVVMSLLQNQPEAKTKGIVMAFAGVIMFALKSVLRGMGIIA